MRVIADLHIHSRYSRATSPQMNLEKIAEFAKIKGLQVLGTGDFTHPKWLEEIRHVLVKDSASTLYTLKNEQKVSSYFMITGEVSTIYSLGHEVKKIHHVILTPNLDTAIQINSQLKKYGDLSIDGRPILKMSSPHLVELIMEISDQNLVFPAHIWTPWFSVLGAFSGFDSIKDCYQDMTKHIYALETGLSSDPQMNWRLSNFDKFTLLSNSDCHSFWPWRIGREANVFEFTRLSYREIIATIRNNDNTKFQFTIETIPAYGKYHWTGHKKCNVSLSPQEAIKLGNICPVCRKHLTKGVDQRVEELANRPPTFKPKHARGFISLLPLSEIIATVLEVGSLYSQKIWTIYNKLIEEFSNEYAVLMDVPLDLLGRVVDEKIAQAIIRVRNKLMVVIPGYDGVYGRIELNEDIAKNPRRKVGQSTLREFC